MVARIMKTKIILLSAIVVFLSAPVIAFDSDISTENKAAWEECVEIESWMTSPFTIELEEEQLVLECWMTSPFQIDVGEEEQVLECWMTSPFTIEVEEEQPVLEC